ncbi:TetR/AcrR family transcriptional regulator [Microbacterium fluvii]|uniref:TetR/AcrR family transcriptional regulator n=1 Tax=Microbacterium fluvii TaxID=415215 RepID=A0ABW2HK01_9MICO|nr:TetR/AcrR family transcriptional regulator [Microbacterium fluvii]MCU4673979.1 TetR/AcrR family transcriptional regulator [Microbacterium fluvii]
MPDPAPVSREEQKRRTRDAITFAARGLFVAQGYTETSVNTIARAAGVSRQGFYLHFSGKAQIVVELMRRIGPEILAMYGDLDEVEDPDVPAVRAWLEQHAHVWHRYSMEFAAMEQALAEDADVAAEWFAFTREIVSRLPRALNAQRRSGATEALARARLHAAVMAVDRSFHFLFLRGHTEDQDAELTALAEILSRQLAH